MNHRVLQLIFILIVIAIFPNAYGDVFKCKDNSGKTTYSDKACSVKNSISNSNGGTKEKNNNNTLVSEENPDKVPVYNIPSITNEDILNFMYFVYEKHKCVDGVRHIMGVNAKQSGEYSDSIEENKECIGSITHFLMGSYDTIEFVFDVSQSHKSINGLFGAGDSMEYHNLLTSLFGSFVNRWGLFKQRADWHEGILQEEIREYFKESNDLDDIIHSITSCANILVNIDTWSNDFPIKGRGRVIMVKSRNGSVKVELSRDLERKYRFKQITEELNKLSEGEFKSDLTKCLNPNVVQ